jgi:hypothetical protein
MQQTCAAARPFSNDLRTPALLILDGILGVAVCLGYAAYHGALSKPSVRGWSVAYGLCAAAAFRLVPPILDAALFYRGAGPEFISPGAMLLALIGAGVHGGIAMLAALPYARRALDMVRRPLWADNQPILYLTGATVLVFFTVAAVVRFLADFAA